MDELDVARQQDPPRALWATCRCIAPLFHRPDTLEIRGPAKPGDGNVDMVVCGASRCTDCHKKGDADEAKLKDGPCHCPEN